MCVERASCSQTSRTRNLPSLVCFRLTSSVGLEFRENWAWRLRHRISSALSGKHQQMLPAFSKPVGPANWAPFSRSAQTTAGLNRLVGIYLQLQRRQGRHIRVLRITPYHTKTFALASWNPLTPIDILYRCGKKDPSHDFCRTGARNAWFLKALFLSSGKEPS